MPPLVLEGETLGQKQHSFNKLVEAAVADESIALLPLDYDAADVDNLVRIEVACRRRDVGHVLAVLQCEDMLYVSRAIKQATWLITDDQYAHIINPKHLHDELFPKMMSKAKNKLLSAIRLNLENEARVDEFFHYFEDDLKVAQKWLPRCSLPLIEKVYRQNESNSPSNKMTVKTVKRLCERSLSVLQILIEIKGIYYIGRKKFTNSKILLSKNAEEYLNTLESLDDFSMPAFGIRATRQMMKHCPDKVVNKFEQFFKNIHLPTFAKYLKIEDIKEFLLKQADNKHWKMEGWFKYENIKHFVKKLPIASRFEFIKQLLIDKDMAFDNRWYRFAPFDTAFTDLKKLIRLESSPAERIPMLTTLISCVRRNPQQVQLVLQYYRDKHINEPFKFKVQFVNSLLSSVATHKLDENTWSILNDIFSSMEVYIESENSVPHCIKAIIVYKLLQKEDIPEIIKKKHTFDTFKDYYKKLEKTERDLVFKYLYMLEMDKLQKQTVITNQSDISSAIDRLLNILLLLKEWEMKLSDFPELLNQIRYIIEIKKKHSIKSSLLPMYKHIVKKNWRKDLFEDSLTLQENDAACVHALKHDPGLLLRHSSEVAAMISNDEISLQNTLRKLRIYWAESLAQNWTDQYLLALEKPTGHKATVEGICILLPRKEFVSLLEKYTPSDTKIDWNNCDTATLSVQKSLAKRMKLVRPYLQLDAILPYAKDDYLQFALPSLNALLYNMSATQVSEYIPTLFDSPVSLKKHGVRLAYSKLRFSEIKDLVENTWRNTKKSSIRTILFKETFELLKNEKKDSASMELWELMTIFIENLTPNENQIVYKTLSRVPEVPLVVRPQFLMKAYTFLKSLPKKSKCILSGLEREASGMIKQLEPNFVEQVLLKSVEELVNIITGYVEIDNCNTVLVDAEFQKEILIAYMANSNDEESQYAKYEKYLIPILDGCFKSWKIFINGERIPKSNCIKLLDETLFSPRFLSSSVINVRIFKEFETRYKTALPLDENYRFVISWTIATIFVEVLHNYINESVDEAEDFKQECLPDKISKPTEENWEDLCTAVAPLFGKACLNFIKQDCSSRLLTLTEFFADSLTGLFCRMKFNRVQELQVLKNMLDSEVTVSYLVVLRSVCSRFYVHAENEESKELILEIFNTIKLYPSPDVKIQFYEFVLRKQPQYFRDIVT